MAELFDEAICESCEKYCEVIMVNFSEDVCYGHGIIREENILTLVSDCCNADYTEINEEE